MMSSIQSLRAIAAFLVVLVHLSLFLHPLGLDFLSRAGGAGVDIFFVISGFIMVQTTSRPGGGAPVLFLKHRLARIVPSYWLLTLFVFIVAVAAPNLFGGTQPTLVNLVRSLGFIPYTRFDGTMRPLLFVGWSLNYEMLFYALFAVALAARNRLPPAALVVGFIGALVSIGAFLIHPSPIIVFYTSPIMLDFAFGVILGANIERLSKNPQAAPFAWVLLALGIVGLLCGEMVGHVFGIVARGPLLTGTAATLIVGAALQLERIGHWPASRWLGSMGDSSYALYLTHPFVTVSVEKFARHWGLITPSLAPFLVLLALTLSALVAVLYFRFIEKPLSLAARRWLAPNKGTVAK